MTTLESSEIKVGNAPHPNNNLPAFAKAKRLVEVGGSREYSLLYFVLAIAVAVVSVVSIFQLSWSSISILGVVVIMLPPAFVAFMIVFSRIYGDHPIEMKGSRTLPNLPMSNYLRFDDENLKKKYENRKIPVETFFEGFMSGKINFAPSVSGSEDPEDYDMLSILEDRHDFLSFEFTWGQVKYFLFSWIPETLWHSQNADMDQVRDHYDRGNDFFASFLGPMMIYTSGIVRDTENRESLETLQLNKLDLVCEKIQLKENERHLDIGCGWGTLAVHAGKKYQSKSVGVTLASNQAQHARDRAKEAGVSDDNAQFWCIDYRDIPENSESDRFDKITCLEMAEHVGVRKFDEFTFKVYRLLKDDGLFFLQIAGLRRRWQLEDLCWGLFMAKYVFPGADASCPLNWVVNKLEYAGFEVLNVDNIGVHYSTTIERWYRNWVHNKPYVLKHYGQRWYRQWALFLAWSVISARQGSATCYQIVCHKNLNRVDRTNFISAKRLVA